MLSVPVPENVLAAAVRPVPTIAQMRGMTIYEIMCGKHERLVALEEQPQSSNSGTG